MRWRMNHRAPICLFDAVTMNLWKQTISGRTVHHMLREANYILIAEKEFDRVELANAAHVQMTREYERRH